MSAADPLGVHLHIGPVRDDVSRRPLVTCRDEHVERQVRMLQRAA